MSARTVSVSLTANVGGFVGAMGKAASAVDQVTSKMGESAKGIAQSATENRQAWDTVGSTLTRVGAVAAAGLGAAATAAISWESAFAGVRKTVDQTSPAFATLEGELRGMARTMATSHTEIASVAEAAGALGVATEDVAGFTKTMVMLGETTNLTANEAADSLAQFMNIMGTAPGEVNNLGSALVALGNDGASTERQIVQMGQRIAGAGAQIGLSEAEVLGFASAIASTGIEVEAGGTAISMSMSKMNSAVREGGKELDLLAQTAGMSAAEFKTAFETDAAGAITAFIEGLGRAHAAGGDMNAILTELGITGEREKDTLRRLALSGDLLGNSLTTANTAMQDGTALMDEYGERAATTESKMRVAWNQIKDAAISTGQVMLPVLGQMAQGVGGLAGAFGSLPQPVQTTGVALTALGAAGLLAGGQFMRAVPAIVEFRAASATLAKDMPKTAAAMSGLGKAAGGLLALTAVVGVLGAIDASMRDTVVNAESLGNAFTAMNQTAGQSGGGIEKLNTQFQQLHQNVGFIGIGEQLNGIGDAMQRVSNPAFGAGIDRFFHELGVGTSTTIEAENAFKALDEQLVNMNPAQAAQGFAQIAEEAKRFGITAEQLIAMFPQYAAQIQGWANANKFAFQDGAAGAQELINMMGGQLPPALAAAGAAAGLTAGEIDGMARTLAAVPPTTTVAVSGEGILPTTTTVEGLRDAIKDVPDDKFVRVTMPDGRVVEGLAKDVRAAIDAIGEEKNIRVAMPGMADVLVGMTTLKTAIEGVPPMTEVSVSIDGAEAVETRLYEVGRLIEDVPDDKSITVNIPGIGNVTLQAGELRTALESIDDKDVIVSLIGAAAARAETQHLADQLAAMPANKTVHIRGEGVAETATGIEGIAKAIEGVPDDKQLTIKMLNGEVVQTTAGQIREALEALQDKNVNVTTNADETKGKLNELAQTLAGVPPDKQVMVSAPGLPMTQASVDQLKATIEGVPNDKPVSITLPNGATVVVTAGQIRDALNQITDKNVSINADAAGALAGAIAAQIAIDMVVDKIVQIGADAAGAEAGAAQAQGAINSVTGTTVPVDVDPSGAQDGAGQAQSAVDGVEGKTVPVAVDPAGAHAGARAAISAIAGIPSSKTVTINFNLGPVPALPSISADGGLVPPIGGIGGPPGPEFAGAQRFVRGGRVAGWSPHPRADNIPGWLTAGEIVQSNKSGDMYGRHRLLALNAGRVDPDDFAAFMRAQGFAGGGQARDAFSRPALVTTTGSGTVPSVMPGPTRTVTQEFNYYYPVSERESTATRRAAADAGLSAMLG